METQTFDSSKKKNSVMLLVSLAFTAAGVLMILDNDLLGWLVLLLFGPGSVVFVINLIPGATRLELHQSGFTTSSLFRRKTYPWEAVAHCYPRRIAGSTTIGLHMSDTYFADRRIVKAISTPFGAALPESYGMDGQELSDIMNLYIERHRQNLSDQP